MFQMWCQLIISSTAGFNLRNAVKSWVGWRLSVQSRWSNPVLSLHFQCQGQNLPSFIQFLKLRMPGGRFLLVLRTAPGMVLSMDPWLQPWRSWTLCHPMPSPMGCPLFVQGWTASAEMLGESRSSAWSLLQGALACEGRIMGHPQWPARQNVITIGNLHASLFEWLQHDSLNVGALRAPVC